MPYKIHKQISELRQSIHERMSRVRIEASAVRTTVAVSLPLIAGQASGFGGIGMMAGLGALWICIADKEGSTLTSILCTCAAVTLVAYSAMVVGPIAWLSVLIMFMLGYVTGFSLEVNDPFQYGANSCALSYAIILGLHSDVIQIPYNILDLCAGGIWTIPLTLLLWKYSRKTDSSTIASEFRNISIRRTKLQILKLWSRVSDSISHHSTGFFRAINFGLVTAFTVVIYKSFHFEHGYWLTLTAIVVLKQDYLGTKTRTFERVTGSILGGTIAIFVAAWCKNSIMLDIFLVLSCLVAFSYLPHNYTKYAAFLTIFVVLLINMTRPGNWEIAVYRVVNTVSGGILALLFSYILNQIELRQRTEPL